VISAARVLTACAVLVGLVSMHGPGAAMGAGCPGGTSSTATSVAPPAMHGGHEVVLADTATTMPGAGLRASAPRSAGHVSVCDSTPPRGDLTKRLARAGTEGVEPVVPGRPVPGSRGAGGAVPRAGPDLISLGVSRT
jgi:hypothetical protein